MARSPHSGTTHRQTKESPFHWIPFVEDFRENFDPASLSNTSNDAPPAGFGAFFAGPENRLAEKAVHWILEGVPLSSLNPSASSRFTDSKRIPEFAKGKKGLAQNRLQEFIPLRNIPQASPLVFYGPSGCGKTHLIGGICRAAAELFPHYAIIRTTGAQFRHEHLSAIRFRHQDEFQTIFNGLDLLVLEDLQDLSEYPETLVELQEIINICQKQKTLLIFSAAEYPERLKFQPALTARLIGGSTIPIVWPSADSRRVLVEKAAELSQLDLEPAACQILIQKLPPAPGALLAAFNKIALDFKGNYLSITAENLLLYFESLAKKKSWKIEEIAKTSATFFKLSLSEVRGKSRHKTAVRARKIAIYLGRELAGLKLQELGRWFAGRNHSTVLYAWREVNSELKNDQELFDNVQKIKKLLEK